MQGICFGHTLLARMALDALTQTDWRGRTRRSSVLLGCIVLSLVLHFGLTLFPAHFDITRAFEPTVDPTPVPPAIGELSVELEAPLEEVSAAHDEPRKTPAAEPIERHERAGPLPRDTPPLEEASDTPEKDAQSAVKAWRESARAGGVTERSEGREGVDDQNSLTGWTASRPGDRLMFDPLRATRGRTRGSARVLIDSSRVRHHLLGSSVAKLITRMDSGNRLNSAGIDPLQESERLFIHTPELGNPSAFVLMIQRRVPSPPGARSLLLAPESVATRVAEMTSLEIPAPPPPAVIWVHLESPNQVLLGMPISAPASLRWVELRIALEARNRVTVRFEAEDADPELAASNARLLARSISEELEQLAQTPTEGGAQSPPSINFHVTGSILVAIFSLEEPQLTELANRVNALTTIP